MISKLFFFSDEYFTHFQDVVNTSTVIIQDSEYLNQERNLVLRLIQENLIEF